MWRCLCWILLLLLLLGGCHRVDPNFTQALVDAQRSLDDEAWRAAYSPAMKLLVVGRESGRLELWNAESANSRIAKQAHELRLQGIAFGPADGIVITNSASGNVLFDGMSQLENGPKFWDARSGELLHAFREPDWSPGAISATPVPGFYLLANGDQLHIYDHHKRQLVGAPLALHRGGITALDWDAESALIALGTDQGLIALLRLKMEPDDRPRLELISQHAPYGIGHRRKVLALKFMHDGRKLVSVQYAPARSNALQAKVPALYRNQQQETVRWDVSTWTRERVYPSELIATHHVSDTRGEDWLVLAGVSGGTARVEGKIELLDLQSGVAWRYQANASHATAVLIPELREGLLLQNGHATRIKYLDQAQR